MPQLKAHLSVCCSCCHLLLSLEKMPADICLALPLLKTHHVEYQNRNLQDSDCIIQLKIEKQAIQRNCGAPSHCNIVCYCTRINGHAYKTTCDNSSRGCKCRATQHFYMKKQHLQTCVHNLRSQLFIGIQQR